MPKQVACYNLHMLPARMFDLDVANTAAFSPSRHSPTAKVVDHMPRGVTVLDMGCATGYMARELARKGCRTWGVDVDDRAVAAARVHCVDAVCCNLDELTHESVRLPFEGQRFDVILLLDVLEHLVRPDLVLPRIGRLLEPEGHVWISLPNVARIEYRLRLMLGRFEYEDAGPLSKGHLGFFTRKTARELLERSGFSIELELPTGFASKLESLVGWSPRRLLAFQFLFCCRRPQNHRSVA